MLHPLARTAGALRTGVAVALALEALCDAKEGAVPLAAWVHEVHPPLELHKAAEGEFHDQQGRCSPGWCQQCLGKQCRRILAHIQLAACMCMFRRKGRTVGDLGVVVRPHLASVIPFWHVEEARLCEQLQEGYLSMQCAAKECPEQLWGISPLG